jgi:hypothetical protein
LKRIFALYFDYKDNLEGLQITAGRQRRNPMVETKNLEEVASRLNKKSNDLNATLQKIQDKINSYNVGIEVWNDDPLVSQDIEMREKEDGTIISPFPDATCRAEETYLGYAKTSDGWSLVVQEREVYYGKSLYTGLTEVKGSYNIRNPQPLLEASRKIRIQALKQLQSLVNNLCQEAKESLESIEEAKKLAEEL